jgi:hypothetical protein
MSMKNFNDNIGNRTRDLPNCNSVPQPTALLRAPNNMIYLAKLKKEAVLQITPNITD